MPQAFGMGPDPTRSEIVENSRQAMSWRQTGWVQGTEKLVQKSDAGPVVLRTKTND